MQASAAAARKAAVPSCYDGGIGFELKDAYARTQQILAVFCVSSVYGGYIGG